MVSTETKVHLGAASLAIAVVAVADVMGLLSEPGLASGVTVLIAYGLLFGGAHLYLAVRGDGGMVPVEARWRYLVMLGILLGTGGLLLVGSNQQVGPVSVYTIGAAVVVSTIVGYFIIEGVAGYQDSQTDL
jgi:phosphatidylglycerophosphate synthase